MSEYLEHNKAYIKSLKISKKNPLFWNCVPGKSIFKNKCEIKNFETNKSLENLSAERHYQECSRESIKPKENYARRNLNFHMHE